MSNIHPARKMSYDELYRALQFGVAEDMIYEHVGEEGLRLYCYTEKTVYERLWIPISIMSRGLILDVEKKEVVATPFPKFFNVGEVMAIDFPNPLDMTRRFTSLGNIPNLPFETFEKLDGSLIIIFHHNGRWKCSTKGSLSSDQAKWAEAWLNNINKERLDPTVTYLAEAIYPQNRIVVDYKGKAGLWLLGAYHQNGSETSHAVLELTAEATGLGLVPRYSYDNLGELLALAKTIDCNSEGWVIRFTDGTRLKIKGDEYCRIHRMVSRLTPLAVWEAMRDDVDLQSIRKELPEEFWGDFDNIVMLLSKSMVDLGNKIFQFCEPLKDLTDKEVGLRLHEFPEVIRRFIFPYRKASLLAGRSRLNLFEEIRPHRNVLPGYRASSSITQVQEGMKE
jgi:RNA ligase